MGGKGLTLLEVLLALAVIGIAFAAFLLSQVSDLRASARSRYATDAKAMAVRTLESLSAEVLRTETVASGSSYLDEPSTGRSFYFVDYFYSCPQWVAADSSVRNGNGANQSNFRQVSCRGEVREGPIEAKWAIRGENGILGEGVVTVVVTAQHDRGPKVTVGRRVTCYDVYPSPTQDKPAPCPPPGGGRR